MTVDLLDLSKKILSPTIKLLGDILGEVITEQNGKEYLDLEEKIRLLAKKYRENDDSQAFDDLITTIKDIPQENRLVIIKAFSVFFQLVNLAEEDYRIHMNEERVGPNEDVDPSIDTIYYSINKAKEAGIPKDQLYKLLSSINFKLVWTAHPTEARRLTTLMKLRKIFRHIEDAETNQTKLNNNKIRHQIKSEITLLWQSDDLREQKVRILDEVRTNLFYFDNTVFHILPEILNTLKLVISDVYGMGDDEKISSIFEFGSWVGGDRDGHPGVTADITIQTLLLHKRLCLRKYLQQVKDLILDLSSSLNHITISDELKRSIGIDEVTFTNFAGQTMHLNKLEPYRRKLDFVRLKIENSLEMVEEIAVDTGLGRTLVGTSSKDRPIVIADNQLYKRSSELLNDLMIIDKSLRTNSGKFIADGGLSKLIIQVEIFGFHLASLDLRQHTEIHHQAIEEIFDRIGIDDFQLKSKQEKIDILKFEISNSRPLGINFYKNQCTAPVIELLDTLTIAKLSLNKISPRSIQSYIISMTKNEVDILILLLLFKESGLIELNQNGIITEASIDLVPLFETKEDLENAPIVMENLFQYQTYRSLVEKRNNIQEIMIGYSDSTKDVGYFQSNYRLIKVQQDLIGIAGKFNIKLRIFHGRGGSISRGGGPTHKAIQSQLPGTVENMKITEQGEVIGWNYANPKIAFRHLEQIISAMISRQISDMVLEDEDNPAIPKMKYIENMEKLADFSSDKYENLVKNNSDFIPFYLQFTPLDVIELATIGSRPSRRTKSDVSNVNSLRAIPWIFSWSQTRLNFPAYFGVGTALSKFISEHGEDQIKEMYRTWPYFESLINNLQMVCLKVDMSIAERYLDLIESGKEKNNKIFELIKNEFLETEAMILKIAGISNFLEKTPDIRNSILRRNPYIDPLNLLQIELLHQWRSMDNKEDENSQELQRLLLHTINGIAAGLRNTG